MFSSCKKALFLQQPVWCNGEYLTNLGAANWADTYLGNTGRVCGLLTVARNASVFTKRRLLELRVVTRSKFPPLPPRATSGLVSGLVGRRRCAWCRVAKQDVGGLLGNREDGRPELPAWHRGLGLGLGVRL